MGKGHILTPSEKSEVPSYMIYFDSESRVDIKITDEDIQRTMSGEKVEKGHDLYLICACFTKVTKKGKHLDDWRDYSEDQGQDFTDHFWDDVDHFVKTKKRCFMFAHNAGYDVIATGCIPSLIKRGYRVQAFSDSNPFFVKLSKYKEGTKEVDRSLTIVSSTNYYQCSLAELGECFGIPKTEINYATPTIQEAIPYCRNDVLILKVAMEAFIDFVKAEKLGSFALTIAGQAMKAFRCRFLKPDTIFIHREKPSLILEREAYAGGRNEAWRIGTVPGPIYYVDVNSMYPAVMIENKFPVKLLTYRKRAKLGELKKFIDKGYQVIASVKLRAKQPIYFKKDRKLVFPVGEFTTTLSTPELIRAIQDNSIIEVYKMNLYECDYIFREYVDYFYNKRLEAKSAGDAVKSLLFKIFLNSLYGKFGQKALNWEKIDDADPSIIKTETIVNVRTGQRRTYKVFGGSRFVKVDKKDGDNEAYNSFPAIAAHVTAYARMLLWKYIETAGLDNVYYMDTDSLFVNKIGYDRLTAAGYIDNKKLGLMKLEEEGQSITINGCKDYKFNNHVKIKGISKTAVKLDEGKYVSTIWRGMSKFIQSGDLGYYKNDMIIKTLTRHYDKGVIDMSGQVTPFIYENDESIYHKEVKQKEQEIREQLQQLKEYIKLQKQLRDPAIDIIIRLHGLKPDLNGAYRDELSNFPYPYRNFKKGCSIDRAVWIINGELNTNYTCNDLLELIFNHLNRSDHKQQIRNLENELDLLKVPDYYKRLDDDVPF